MTTLLNLLPTFVLFFAIISTICTIITIVEWSIDRQSGNNQSIDTTYTSLVFIIIATSSFWSLLFYLLH